MVAYAHARPIATAGCQVVDGVARLYGGGTLAQARGGGGYRATVAARLQIAREHGAELGVVQARVNTSRPILTRLGFQSYGEGRQYKLQV